jgi:N-acyl-L-homoserine lactone synthetase
LISVGGDGGVGGSLRLRRADKGTLLFDLFPQLVQGSRVDLESPDVWEITRVIRTPSNRSRGPVKTSLHAAMLEFALTRGARTFVGVCDTFMLPGILSIWKKGFRPLGLPTPYAEGEMIAVRFDVDLETLEQARARGERQTCTMFELPPPASKKSNPLLEAAILAAARDLTTDGVFELLAQLKDHSRSVLPLAS